MQKKIQFTIEMLHQHNDGTYGIVISRMKVIGGWIVHFAGTSKGVMNQSTQFIADRDHEWTIIQPKKEEIPAEKAGTNWENPKA